MESDLRTLSPSDQLSFKEMASRNFSIQDHLGERNRSESKLGTLLSPFKEIIRKSDQVKYKKIMQINNNNDYKKTYLPVPKIQQE